MIRVDEDYAAVVADDLSEERGGADAVSRPDPQAIPDPQALAATSIDEGAKLGLEVLVGARGRFMALPDGRRAARRKLYAIAGANEHEPLEAARQIMRHIADKHGAGTVWMIAQGAKYVNTHGKEPPRLAMFKEGDREVVHVIMAAFYAHSATAETEPAS